VKNHAHLVRHLLEIVSGSAVGLGELGQIVEPLLAVFLGIDEQLLRVRIPVLRHDAVEVSKQSEGPYVIRIGRHQLFGGVQRLRRITGLLVGAHQKLERLVLHDAVGILGIERFQAADFRGRILRTGGGYIGVVLRRIFDHRRRRLRCGRLCLCWRRGRLCRCCLRSTLSSCD
jgi:hypothetical protein